MTEYTLSWTTSGGNGHLAATQKMEEKELAKGRSIIRLNMLDCCGERTGKMFTSWWNNAQKAGDVKKLHFLLKLKKLAEVVFATPIFLRTLYAIYKYNIVKVVDTQPLGTVSIVKAVAIANLFRDKPIKVHKVLTDLPPLSEHFYSGIRKIPRSQKKIFRVITCPPLLKKGETEEKFWNDRCRLSLKKGQVKYKNFPVRDEFFIQKSIKEVQINNSEEEIFIHKIFSDPHLVKSKVHKSLQLDIPKKALVSTVLLASQGTEEAMLKYFKNITKECKKSQSSRPHYLFLLCGKNEVKQPSLYKKVCKEILKTRLPSNLKVIPLSFQDADVLSALYRSKGNIFTKSSGLVSMELLTAAGQDTKIYIHCETLSKKVTKTSLKLLNNMPAHEKGNAIYLMHKRNAKLITPDLVKKAFKKQHVPIRP